MIKDSLKIDPKLITEIRACGFMFETNWSSEDCIQREGWGDDEELHDIHVTLDVEAVTIGKNEGFKHDYFISCHGVVKLTHFTDIPSFHKAMCEIIDARDKDR